MEKLAAILDDVVTSWSRDDVEANIISSDEAEEEAAVHDVTSLYTNEIDQKLLSAASLSSSSELVLLMDSGAFINVKDKEGSTALHISTENRLTSNINVLMARSANANLSNSTGSYPLHIATENNDAHAIAYLLGRGKDQIPPKHAANVDVVNADECTSLHIAARLGYVDSCRVLLEANANTEMHDSTGDTPLILASKRGHVELVRLLVSYECDLDARNMEGRTALMEGTHAPANSLAIVHELIKAGCHVNVMDVHGYTALSETVTQADDPDKVAALLAGGCDAEIQDTSGKTSLHIATLLGHRHSAAALIQARCSLDLRDEHNYTALSLAAWDPWRRHTTDILVRLCLGGAQLDPRDHGGLTPLLRAWQNNTHVLVLIQHGCDLGVTFSTGMTPLELAAVQHNWELVAVILSSAGDLDLASLRKPRVKCAQEYAHLRALCAAPRSLRQLCRLTLRAHLQRRLFSKATSLPLPALLQRYLCMREVYEHPLYSTWRSDTKHTAGETEPRRRTSGGRCSAES